MAGKYIELYNQSDEPVDVSGLYIGIVESESTPAYTLKNLHDAFADSVILLKQIYRIPTNVHKLVEPGGTVIICNSAIDHSVNNALDHNLLDADFEVKDVAGRYQNNPATPALEMIYQMYNGTSIINILQGGSVGVVIFRTGENVGAWQKVYKYGKSSGMQWVLCPRRLIIDGMEALKNKTSGIDVSTKRLYDNINAGYTYINATAGWSGETVYRKILKRSGKGHRILVDTNNSSNDFKVSTKIQPREYDDQTYIPLRADARSFRHTGTICRTGIAGTAHRPRSSYQWRGLVPLRRRHAVVAQHPKRGFDDARHRSQPRLCGDALGARVGRLPPCAGGATDQCVSLFYRALSAHGAPSLRLRSV